ncbi:MAG: PBP1A family penicillin-binding protein [Nitrospiraceae bacterium]|nr:PBP1A family penicillin-binding protein [Nitrospiraceae bacterium]
MKFFLRVLLIIIPLMAGAAVGGYFGFIRGAPSIEQLREGNMPGTRIYADDDTLITEISAHKNIQVPFRRIPQDIINAVVSVEDARFYKHPAIDYEAVIRAALTDLYFHRVVQGGSTITQQLAKITFLTPARTFKRKLREAALAIKIAKHLTRDEILELYLNRVYFGHGAYGVAKAAKLYFGTSVSRLTLPEAALLAGLIKGPAEFSPFIDPARAKERQVFVLGRMRQQGYITEKQMERAVRTPIKLSAARPPSDSYAYFVDYVKKYLIKKYGPKRVFSGGLKVYTTLNKGYQVSAQEALRRGLRQLDKQRGWRGPLRHMDDLKMLKTRAEAFLVMPAPSEITEATVLSVTPKRAIVDIAGEKGVLPVDYAMWASKVLLPGGKTRTIRHFDLTRILSRGDVILVKVISASYRGRLSVSLEQEPTVQGAVVSMDPRTGYVRALVGGYDYTRSDFDRALYAKRQPGSAFKPIIYGAALDRGIPPSYVIDDSPVTFHWDGGTYSPHNYEHNFSGPVSLRYALDNSINVVAVKLLDQVGVANTVAFARRMGIGAPMPDNLTLALGSLSIAPIKLLCAYAPYCNGGFTMKPIMIKYITDSRGRILESDEPSSQRVISPRVAFLMTTMLEDVIKNGTGWRASVLGPDVAGKTGTTSDFRDAWFVGYSPDVMTSVWVGFDDMRPLGPGETGARAALPIWVDFMKYVLAQSPPGSFEPPAGIVSYTVDSATGAIVGNSPAPAGSEYYKEYFMQGTSPGPDKGPGPAAGPNGPAFGPAAAGEGP